MKFTLGKKVGLGFGAIIALILVNAAVSYTKLASIGARQEKILGLRTPTVVAGRDLQGFELGRKQSPAVRPRRSRARASSRSQKFV